MTVSIGGTDYDSYADVAFADTFLAADIRHATKWAAASADNKGRCLVGATRGLQRLGWKDGDPPGFDNVATKVQEATALYAAAILEKPKLAGQTSTGSNIKKVKAGPAEVEFFSQDDSQNLPVPADVWAVMVESELLSDAGTTVDIPIYTGGDQETHFTLDDD